MSGAEGAGGMGGVPGEAHFDSPLHARGETPFFSVCIPQFNRTNYLIEALAWLGRQTFRDVEVCISDDRSTDGLAGELLEALRSTGLSFRYRRQEDNLRYDRNLANAIGMSRGTYCLPMGNDDRFASEDELAVLHALIQDVGPIGVAISNFRDDRTGKVEPRMPTTALHPGDPAFAVSNFRNYAFVSGVVLDGATARQECTDRWAEAEMLQMYLGTRIVASGQPFLSVARTTIVKDIQITGESRALKPPSWGPDLADGFTDDSGAVASPGGPAAPTSSGDAPRAKTKIRERKTGLRYIAPLVVDAVSPYTTDAERQVLAEAALRQLLSFTYPYWIFERRASQSWRFAVGICLGMRPAILFQGFTPPLRSIQRARLGCLYGLVTTVGLITPLVVYERAKPALFRLAKSGVLRMKKLAGRSQP